jgi:hypothetical protein
MPNGGPTGSDGGEGPASPARAAGARGDAEAAGSPSTSDDAFAPPGGPPDRKDRKAYLEEQIQRQKRGEPIDVDWVAEELQRVRIEQITRLQASQQNLRWLVIGAAALMLVLWAQKSGMLDRGGYVMFGLMALVVIAAFLLRRGTGSKPGPPPT